MRNEGEVPTGDGLATFTFRDKLLVPTDFSELGNLSYEVVKSRLSHLSLAYK